MNAFYSGCRSGLAVVNAECAGMKDSFLQSQLFSSCSSCFSLLMFSISPQIQDVWQQSSQILFLSFPASSHPRSSIAWRKEIQEDELTGVQARFATLQKSSLLLCCTSNQSDARRLYVKIFIDVYDNKLLDIKFFGSNLGIFMSVHKFWSMDWLLQLLISHGGHCWHGDRANGAIAS